MAIRPAQPSDVPSILALVRELAEYERAPEQVLASETDFTRAFFGDGPSAWCLVADDGGIIGYAIYFLSFSTWLGQHGIYVEDIYVQEEHRGHGVGTAFLQYLAHECVINGYGRLEWSVLDWNTPAWAFYRGLGAQPMDEWTMHRISGTALSELARTRHD
jgi:GNAT superfamily N-acetyltransferase